MFIKTKETIWLAGNMEFAWKWRNTNQKFQQNYNKCNERKGEAKKIARSKQFFSCSCANVCVCICVYLNMRVSKRMFFSFWIKDDITYYFSVLMLFLSHIKEKTREKNAVMQVGFLYRYYSLFHLFYDLLFCYICLLYICLCVSSGGDFFVTTTQRKEKRNFLFSCLCVRRSMDISFKVTKKYTLTI